jgi:hypothetical protein
VVTESILSVPCSTLASAGAHADASSRTSADARAAAGRRIERGERARAIARPWECAGSVATGGPSRRARARLQNRGSNPVGGEEDLATRALPTRVFGSLRFEAQSIHLLLAEAEQAASQKFPPLEAERASAGRARATHDL